MKMNKIQFGCLARYFNLYEEEILFASKHGFDFMQMWYDNKGFWINNQRNESAKNISNNDFPAIIHAVLDINDFEEHISKIDTILNELKHKELIIHPVCKSEPYTENTIKKLNEKIQFTLDFFQNRVTVFLENNSKIDPIFHSVEEVQYIFENNRDLKFLLDIAHIPNYEYLEEIIKIKMPEILHISDKRFDVIHEHLPISEGEIDFEKVFSTYLANFEGKIIFEVFESDAKIVDSYQKIKSIVSNRI
jgi:sugar phosphate isomerase/epimerase